MSEVKSSMTISGSTMTELCYQVESFVLNGFRLDGDVKLNMSSDKFEVEVIRVDFID